MIRRIVASLLSFMLAAGPLAPAIAADLPFIVRDTDGFNTRDLEGIHVINDAGTLETISAALTVTALVTVDDLDITGERFTLNSDAAGSGADWTYDVSRPTSGMTAAVTLTLPPDAGTVNFLLETDGTGVMSWIDPATLAALIDHGGLLGLADDDHTQYILHADLVATGLVARTGVETYAQRTLIAPAAGISVADGDGVAGNPTISLANDLSALEGLASTGIAVRSAADTWVQRTITGDSEIVVANGDGVAGNPTLSIASSIARDSELHAAVTVSGARDYFTLVGQDLVRGVVDISDDTNLAGASGIVLSGDQVAFDFTATLAGNPTMGAGEAVFGTTGLIFEGATANLLEGLLTVVDPTVDRTWTLPDATGTIALTSELHSAVTLSGARDYLTLVGQDIVRGVVDVSDDTNLSGDAEIVLTGDALSIAAALTRDAEFNTEALLEAFLSGVADVFTNNDGALDDDDLSDDTLDALSQTSLADPNADRIVFWDDSDTLHEYLVPNTGLAISVNNLNVTGLTVSEFASAAISQWTNDSGYLAGNETITLSGDVTGSGTTAITTTIAANAVLESMLKAVNAAADEDILTFETTTGDFEWHTPGELGLALSSDILDWLRADIADSAVGEIDFLAGVEFDVWQTLANATIATISGNDPIFADEINLNGETITWNNDAAGSGADWKYSLTRPTSGMTAVVTLTFPVDDGTANQVLSTDGAGVLSWVSGGGSDADTLDSLDSLQFLRSDTSDTAAGEIDFTAGVEFETWQALDGTGVATVSGAVPTFASNIVVTGEIRVPLMRSPGSMTFRTVGNGTVFVDWGALMVWRDIDSGFATRMSLNSATGDLNVTGVIEAGSGTPGVATGPGDIYATDDGEFDGFLTALSMAVGSDVDPGANIFTVGVLDTTIGRVIVRGDATTFGGQIRMDLAGNQDATHDYWSMFPVLTELFLGPDTDPNAFIFQTDGDLQLTAGVLDIDGTGVNDLEGSLEVALTSTFTGEADFLGGWEGDTWQSLAGLEIASVTSQDVAFTGEVDFLSGWGGDVWKSLAGLGVATVSGQKVTFAANIIAAGATFTGGGVTMGVEDTTLGKLIVYGSTSVIGGSIEFRNAGDNDIPVESWGQIALGQRLEMGPNTDPNAFIFTDSGNITLTAGIFDSNGTGVNDFEGSLTVALGITPEDLTASLLVSSDGAKKLVSVADLTSWIAGTANEITVTDDADGTITIDIPDSPEIGGLMGGWRAQFQFGNEAQTTSGYMFSPDGTRSKTGRLLGLPMLRAGSITGLSLRTSDQSSTHSTDGTVTLEVRINDVPVFSVTTATITSGLEVTATLPQPRGEDTFSVGDRLELRINYNTFAGTIDSVAYVEVVFDD